MDSNKVEAVSKRSQAYILIKQRLLSLLENQVWSKRGENGTFERKKAAEDLKFQVEF